MARELAVANSIRPPNTTKRPVDRMDMALEYSSRQSDHHERMGGCRHDIHNGQRGCRHNCLEHTSAGDLVAAIAVSTAGDVWDAGVHGLLPGSYAEATVAGDTAILDAARKAASYIKLTAVREITATVASHALTAGKANIFVEYVLSD